MGTSQLGTDQPSMRKRHIFLILSLLLVAGALGTLLWLRQRALPEAVRLLPESDAVVFVNVKAIRRVANTSLSGVVREPEYEEFIRGTGIDFERDLDEVAVAVHSIGKNEHRYSEIFNARFDWQKLTDYLRRHAKNVVQYDREEIFEIPQENRTVRVAILDLDSVAVSRPASRTPLRSADRPVGRPCSSSTSATARTPTRRSPSTRSGPRSATRSRRSTSRSAPARASTATSTSSIARPGSSTARPRSRSPSPPSSRARSPAAATSSSRPPRRPTTTSSRSTSRARRSATRSSTPASTRASAIRSSPRSSSGAPAVESG